MSVNTTPFLHLPQWDANEQPSYLGEINPAFAAIDSGYGDIKTLAQTGVSGSQEAITTANAAKAQSQANAGAITTLQQGLTQLEADFIDAHYVKTAVLEITPVANVTFKQRVVTYNNYFANIYLEVTTSADISLATGGFGTLIGSNITGLPGVVKKLNGISNINISEGIYIPVVTFTGTELYITGLPGNLVLHPGNYAVFFNAPVFITNNTRNIMFDNCLYLNGQNS